MKTKTQHICPSCGGKRSVPVKIIFGHPLFPGDPGYKPNPDHIDNPAVEYAGCVIERTPPKRLCRRCGHKWEVPDDDES
jgi:rRNA maturation endonuclease Nob1